MNFEEFCNTTRMESNKTCQLCFDKQLRPYFEKLEKMETAITCVLEDLIPVLCNPDGNVCIEGPNMDRFLIQRGINTLKELGGWEGKIIKEVFVWSGQEI